MRSFLCLSALLFTPLLAPNPAQALEAKPAAERTRVADFTLKDLKGKPVKLSTFRGKVVVISFWATWCDPCMQQLPHLDRKALALPDDFVVLALSTDNAQTISKVRSTVRRNRWKMPVLPDTDGQVTGDLNPRGAHPYTMFIDRAGRLAADRDGYAPGDEVAMLALIDQLIAQKPQAAPAK
jgi:peroxiredoxin